MARGDKNNGNNGDQNETGAENGSDNQVTEDRRAEDQGQSEGRTMDQRDVEGAQTSTEQPHPGMPWSQRMDAHSPMPEGDTGAHNAGNASPAVGDRYPTNITTHHAPEGAFGPTPDRGPSPWPVAPAPTDPGLVSPTGIVHRPAHHEAAISHLTMRLGEMRNFLAGFGHDDVLADHPELHSLVSNLKHSLGLPQDPREIAAGKVRGTNADTYVPGVAGPGSGAVAQSGARWGNGPERVSGTSAGSYAQGSYGPAGMQENNR